MVFNARPNAYKRFSSIIIYDVRRNNGAQETILTKPGTKILTMDLLRETGVAWVLDSAMGLHIYDLLQCTEYARVYVGPAESGDTMSDVTNTAVTPKYRLSPSKTTSQIVTATSDETEQRRLDTPALIPSLKPKSTTSPVRYKSSPGARSTTSLTSSKSRSRSNSVRFGLESEGGLRRQSSSDLFAYYLDQQSPYSNDDDALTARSRSSSIRKRQQYDSDAAAATTAGVEPPTPYPATAIRATSPLWTFTEPTLQISSQGDGMPAIPVVSIPDQNSLAVQELLMHKAQLEFEGQLPLQPPHAPEPSPGYSISAPSTPAETEPALPEPILPDCLFTNVGELMQDSPAGLDFSETTGALTPRKLLEVLFGWPIAFSGSTIRDVLLWELKSLGSNSTFVKMVLNMWIRQFDSSMSKRADGLSDFGNTLTAVLESMTSRAMTVSMTWLVFAMHLVGMRDSEEKVAVVKKFVDEVLFRDKESYGDDVEAVHLATGMMIGCGLIAEAREVFRENAYYLCV